MRIASNYLITCIALLYAMNISAQKDSVNESGLKRWWNSLVNGNVDRTYERGMDMSFVVAPCYTREGGLGIGGAATALYRLDRNDSIMQPSDFSLSGSITVNGFYAITAKGNNNFRGNRYRLSYRLQFQNKNLDFWGIGYDECSVNSVAEYKRQMMNFETDFVCRLTRRLNVGVALNVNYTAASQLSQPEYLRGQRSSCFVFGIGASLQYDTRDFILNPQSGMYFLLREVIYPNKLGNVVKTILGTTLTFDCYNKIWSGGVVALDLYGKYNGTDVPWTMREEMGSGTSRMRGYYAGRYIDNNQISAQVELRQHVYSRIGCVVWGGGGTVFSSFNKQCFSDILPNFGMGLRIGFKHNVNVRIDYGFGKDTGGFIFQFAEAF